MLLVSFRGKNRKARTGIRAERHSTQAHISAGSGIVSIAQSSVNQSTSTCSPEILANHDHKRGRISRVRWRLHLHRKRFLNMMSIWRSAFRSFRGHIEVQSSKEIQCAEFGSVFRPSQSGHLVANTRTSVRNYCTEKLSAMHSWVDIPDVKIFLMGFDVGELFGRSTLYNETEQPNKSWITLTEIESEIQQSSRDNDHTSGVISAAIAGVTRNDECTRQKL